MIWALIVKGKYFKVPEPTERDNVYTKIGFTFCVTLPN